MQLDAPKAVILSVNASVTHLLNVLIPVCDFSIGMSWPNGQGIGLAIV
jgi:hypothetical protein